MAGDSVAIEPVEVLDHYGDIIVGRRPDLVMGNYFPVRDGTIVTPAVVVNQPSDYGRTAG